MTDRNVLQYPIAFKPINQEFEVFLFKNTLEKIEEKHGIKNAIDVLGWTLTTPEEIRYSNYDAKCHLYYFFARLTKQNSQLFYTAVVDIAQKKIKTLYISSKRKEGVQIWKNQ